jgi:hypothetical protein
MIRFLRRNQQLFILLIFIYALFAVFSVYFIKSFTAFSGKYGVQPFLTGFPKNFVASQNSYLIVSVLVVLMVLTIGFYLVRMEINYLIIPNRSQFAALFYLSISSFGFKDELFSGAIMASVFLLLAIDRVFSTLDNKNISYRFIDAGILLALGSLFYINLLFLFPFLWLSQLTLRSNFRKELLYSFIGLLLPFIYIFSLRFIFDKPVHETIIGLQDSFTMHKSPDRSLYFLSAMGFYIVIIVIASFFALQRFGTTKIQVRKLYQLFLYLFINILIIYMIVPSAGYELFFIVSIPLSTLLSIYFAECRSNLLNTLILLLLIGIPLALNFIR